jgi:cytochrome P450
VNPEACKKAQEEIDRATGGDRLPDYHDRPSLPYVEAFYREVMRWRPAFPLGVAHSVTNDDVYEGYFIPKGRSIIHWQGVLQHLTNRLSNQGATIISNVW